MARLYLDRLTVNDQFKVLDATIEELQQVKGMVSSAEERRRVQKSIRHYERRWQQLAGERDEAEGRLLETISALDALERDLAATA